MVSLNDLADRPPVAITDEPLDIGGHVMRFLPTPHVPQSMTAASLPWCASRLRYERSPWNHTGGPS